MVIAKAMGQEEWGNSDGKRGNGDDRTAVFNQSIAMGHWGTGAAARGAQWGNGAVITAIAID
jgi:hypothetical protein